MAQQGHNHSILARDTKSKTASIEATLEAKSNMAQQGHNYGVPAGDRKTLDCINESHSSQLPYAQQVHKHSIPAWSKTTST